MSLTYKCPTPNCDTWSLNDETYRGGTIFLCTTCSKTSRIPLYCPKCNPPGTNNWQFLNGNVSGGAAVRCPKGHTFTIPVSIEEIYLTLKSYGEQIGDRYAQAGHIQGLPQSIKPLVSGGMCNGISADWIRRALLAKKYNFSVHKERTHVRHAVSQVSLGKDVDAFNQRNQELRDAFNQLVNAYNNTIESNTAIDRKRNEYKEKVRLKINEMSVSELQGRSCQSVYDDYCRIIDERLPIADLVDPGEFRPLTSPVVTFYWPEYCSHMNKVLSIHRSARNKSGNSSRGFDRLQVRFSQNSKEYPGVSNFVNAILQNPEFLSNRAALIGINPPQDGAVGHAIALLRENTGGNYIFFEPNFGTFRLPTVNVAKAIHYIFTVAYPNSDGSDSHPYEIGGKIRGTFTIFEGDLPPVVTLTETLQLNTIEVPSILNANPLPQQEAEKITPKVGQSGPTQNAKPSQFVPTVTNSNPTTNTSPLTNRGGAKRLDPSRFAMFSK